MGNARGNEKNLAGRDGDWRLTLELIFERPFDDVDDFLARMAMPRCHRSRGNVDARLLGFAARDRRVVTLQVGARASGWARWSGAQCREAGDVLFIPNGTAHAARNIGTGNAAELATYVIEKGKPLTEFVK